MLRTTLVATSALAALLLCAACEQRDNPQASQQQQQDQQDLAKAPAPTPAERTAAEATNEIEQAVEPTAVITPRELAAGINAKDVPNPATTLSTAAVRTSSGQALGEVRSVDVGPDGKANAVIVEVGGFLNVGERAVSIDAKKFTYLKDRNMLVASLAKSDVEKMPPAKAPHQ